MPEIAEVRTVAKTLNERIVGRKIKDINIIYDKIITDDLDYFKSNVIGRTISEVTNYGKYLLIKLGDKTIVSHLRMEGKYFIKNKNDEIVKHEHIIFILDNDLTLRYHDTRKFGRMFVCDTKDIFNTKEISKLGYEPNDKRLTSEYLFKKIHDKKVPIKTLLLDQSIINGLGNIYVDEVLFASRINPERMGCNVNLDECENIIINSKEITDEATRCGGSTIRSYTSSLGVYGTYQDKLKIHTKDICPICNAKVNKIRVGGRGTYICSKCQK